MDPFLGEIRPFAFGLIPRGWAACDGQVLGIQQNQALFSLLGTTYGGNGTTTFGLPDLRGRTGLHFGPNHPEGQVAGEENHTLTIQEMPGHTHAVFGSTEGPSTLSPVGAVWATRAENAYNLTADGNMSAAAIATAGTSQAHSNMQPYCAVNFCIALVGIYPSWN